MQNSQYGEWIFVRSIPNHVISYDLKPEGTRGEVGTRVALTREAHERFYCVANLVAAMYSQISVRSEYASGWRTNLFMNGGVLCSSASAC